MLTDKLSLRSKVCLGISLTIMASFFLVQSLVVFEVFKPTYTFALFGYGCILAFTPPFFSFVQEFLSMINSKEQALLEEVMTKNTYLEHAAKILRHDMHSGINTYMPRGLRGLKRRLTDEKIKELKIESPMKLISEGLEHSQQVYKGVFEFTNLVREDSELTREMVNTHDALENYLKRTSYKDQVIISDLLPSLEINEALFCTAIDNLIRNGLKYNDSATKWVKIDYEEDYLTITDNGRGMSQLEFEKLCTPYMRRKKQKESGTGLGLNICVAIFKEHGYAITSQKLEQGTKIRIKIND